MRRGAWQVRGGKIGEDGSRFSSAGGVERRGVTALSIRDYVAMVAGFLLCLTISWTLGHGRIFWEDEMLGWMLLTDPSWHHMIQAWNQGADGGGFAFYASGRIWLHLFGPSEVAFRAYSATCFGLAFAVNWMTFRRFYERWVTGFALFNTWFCSPPIVLHLVEGRFYGLLMLFASVVLWFVIRLQDSVGRTPVRLYVGFFAANAVLTTSHLLGVVYSVFLLVALVALDLLAGRRRPALYVCAAASWLLLLPERYSIEASAAVGRPWFWTVQPPLYRLLGPLTGYSGEIAAVIALLLVPLGISVRRRGGAWRGELLQAYRARRSLYVGSFALVLTAVAFLLEGFVGPSLFINRYLMPVSIATAFLTAEVVQLTRWEAILPTRIYGSPRARGRLLAGATLALAGVILSWVFLHLPRSIFLQEDYTPALTAMLPKGVPVLIEDAFTFTELVGRQHSSGVEYVYPLDWDQSASAAAPRVEVTHYHLMQNWQRVGYFSGSIVDFGSFVRTHERFIVVDGQVLDDHPQPWMLGDPLALRLAHTPGYTLTRIGALDNGGLIRTAWLVSHDPAKTDMPKPREATDYQ